MTALELIHYLNSTYGFHKEWPETLEVDHETYANCCQFAFKESVLAEETNFPSPTKNPFLAIAVIVGKANSGLIFKNVELLLKIKKPDPILDKDSELYKNVNKAGK